MTDPDAVDTEAGVSGRNAPSSVDRRSFLVGGVAAGLGAVAGLNLAGAPGPAGTARADTDPNKPNILVIMIDEMRTPQWFPSSAALAGMLPNIAALERKGVTFTQHYTAANMCTPSRGALVTGLYPHQTGCMIVSESTLSPKFPTWGSILRKHGYQSVWWGKWHLGKLGDESASGLRRYGFAGGTFPSPNGAPSEGLAEDPKITDQFIGWLKRSGGDGPWCTTVSLVNPHDIQWWPRAARQQQPMNSIPKIIKSPAPNFETPDVLDRNKPGLQTALRHVQEMAVGLPVYTGPGSRDEWTWILNLYLYFQRAVDQQIGRIMAALNKMPEVARNTVVIFTSDHGDYIGSHGLHGKGGGAYDEGIRVPLTVYDPRGTYSASPGVERHQMTSSVDIVPLMLTLATGGNDWRSEAAYQHLAGRADLAAMCRNPSAPGRPWIAHCTDEKGVEEGALVFAGGAPGHVVALRTPQAKLVDYSHWKYRTMTVDKRLRREHEVYDYSTRKGRMELDNKAGHSAVEGGLRNLMDSTVIPKETDAPLPGYLKAAQREGWADYFAHAYTPPNPFGI